MENSTITISYKVKGMIDHGQINEFFEQMASIAKDDRKINLALEMHQIDGLRKMTNFFSDEKFQRMALRCLRKFALITDSEWMNELGDFINLLPPDKEVQVFDIDEREEANTWIQALTKQEDLDLKERVKQGYAHLVQI